MTDLQLLLVIVVGVWLTWASRILENFEEDFEEVSWWRGTLVQLVVIFGAGFFMIEEVLEIVIDWLLEEEE